MSGQRVVVTGLGVVSPIGLNTDDFWANLIAGRNGISPISAFDTSSFSVKVAGEVKNFNPEEYLDLKTIDRTGRFSQFAMTAAKMAIQSSYLDVAKIPPDRIGVTIATTGEVWAVGKHEEVLQKRGPKRVDPLLIGKISAHMAPVHVALMTGARGPNTSVNSACASGSDAIGIALNHLRQGSADVMIAGGTEALISPLAVASASVVGALSRETDTSKASRPFDLNRDGFVYGEGAGILILETYSHAQDRGAPIIAELAGAGWSFDATNMTAPDAEGQALCIKAAIKNSSISNEEIDYINAHGTSTKLNDIAETNAIKLVFGKKAYNLPISSNKSMFGHLAAAAGAVEAVSAVLTINGDMIPPTINYETPDPECDLDYVPNTARKVKVNICLSNSFGLGGQNCSLIFKRFQ
jgi:3-oxoacyl-[acyl-carrier-protein] synthase II